MFNKNYEAAVEYFANNDVYVKMQDVMTDYFGRYDRIAAIHLLKAEMVNFNAPVIRVTTTDGEHYSPMDWIKNHSEEDYSFMKVEKEIVGHRLVLMK